MSTTTMNRTNVFVAGAVLALASGNAAPKNYQAVAVSLKMEGLNKQMNIEEITEKEFQDAMDKFDEEWEESQESKGVDINKEYPLLKQGPVTLEGHDESHASEVEKKKEKNSDEDSNESGFWNEMDKLDEDFDNEKLKDESAVKKQQEKENLIKLFDELILADLAAEKEQEKQN
jgi:hypothetical protein